MKKVFFSLLLLLLAAGCSSDDEVVVLQQEEETNTEGQNDEGQDTDGQNHQDEVGLLLSVSLTDAQRNAVQKNNDFAFRLFRTAVDTEGQTGRSMLLSPLSLTYALGMLNVGATGLTCEEITTLLGFGRGEQQAINDLCKQLIGQIPALDKSVTLHLADVVAADKSLQLKKQYRQDVADYYYAEVASLDFGSRQAIDYINVWCKEKTEGMIPMLVDTLYGRIALLNAVYFNAPWTVNFDKKDTRQEPFTLEDGRQTNVPMMHLNSSARYAANDTYAVLGLPFGRGGNWHLFVLLPNEGRSVDDVLSTLDSNSWNETLYMAGYSKEVDVKLPRFKAESYLKMEETLQEMGCSSMFFSKNELPRISENAEDLYVNLVRQRTFLEVSEEGAEASAVTVIGMGTSSGRTEPEEKHIFHATRPFVYMIQERTSGAIFFIGQYCGE